MNLSAPQLPRWRFVLPTIFVVSLVAAVINVMPPSAVSGVSEVLGPLLSTGVYFYAVVDRLVGPLGTWIGVLVTALGSGIIWGAPLGLLLWYARMQWLRRQR